MFDRFTEQARQVVVLAQDEARALKHNYIGTEHILLGLLREQEGVAVSVLESLDITVEEVRVQVARIVGQGDEVTTGPIALAPRAKKVFELAQREASALGRNRIDTEHILLAIVRENEGVAARILLDLDADAAKIRNEMRRDEVYRRQLDERLKACSGPPAHERYPGEPFAELKSRIHFAVIGDLGPRLYNVNMDPDNRREMVRAGVYGRLTLEIGISRTDLRRILLEIADDILGRGPLERLLADDSVTEIMVNGPYEVWIGRQGCLASTDVQFTDEWQLRRIINTMISQVGLWIDETSPIVDARLPDGSRLIAVLPPLSRSGPVATIRKFSRERLTLDDMIKLGTLNQETVEFLQRCVQAQLNILISGGTGSGKTTLLNALSAAVPDDERIITIEDATELRLNQPHVIRFESPPKDLAGENEISIRSLVRVALGMRPDRIIVGEIRDAEALDLLQAMNTGHDGCLSTIHANSPRDALARIETMVLMAGYDLPVRAVRGQASSALDLIIQLQRLEDGSRRVTSIAEVQRMEADTISLQELFKFQIDEVTADGKIVGGLRPTGLRPTFAGKFEKHGIALPLGLFNPDRPEWGEPRDETGGSGVREFRRPIKPTSSAGAAVDPTEEADLPDEVGTPREGEPADPEPPQEE